MSKTELTPDEIDDLAEDLASIARDIKAVSRSMRESNVERIPTHISDLTARIIPTVRLWSVRLNFSLERLLTARGTKLRIAEPEAKPSGRKKKPKD